MPAMYLRVRVPPASALARGSTLAGEIDHPLVETELAELDEYERAALAPYVTTTPAASGQYLSAAAYTWDDIKAAIAELGEKRRREEQSERAKEAKIEMLLDGPDDPLVVCRESMPAGQRWKVSRAVIPLVGYNSRAPLYDRAARVAGARNRDEWDREQARHLERSPANFVVWSEAADQWVAANLPRPPAASNWPEPAREVAQHEADRRNHELAENRKQAERWVVEAEGTQDQRERWAAGVLPEAELRDLARAALMEPLAGFKSRRKLSSDDLDHDGPLAHDDIEIEISEGAKELSASEWSSLKAIESAADQAVAIAPVSVAPVTVRARCMVCGAYTQEHAVRVEMKWAGRTLARELAL